MPGPPLPPPWSFPCMMVIWVGELGGREDTLFCSKMTLPSFERFHKLWGHCPDSIGKFITLPQSY